MVLGHRPQIAALGLCCLALFDESAERSASKCPSNAGALLYIAGSPGLSWIESLDNPLHGVATTTCTASGCL